MLRPKILAEARPGTRVVTNVWDLGSWQPDQIDTDGPQVSMWVVPARIEGNWTWDLRVRGTNVRYSSLFEQRFQRAEGFMRVGARRALLREVLLRGDQVSVKVDMTIGDLGFVRHEFTGVVRGDTIEGSVGLVIPAKGERTTEETVEILWRATRAASSGYLAPTGLNAP